MTPKQHQFAREVVLGKSQADAYRSAYNTLKMNDNSIRREVSRLMDNPKVATTVVGFCRKVNYEGKTKMIVGTYPVTARE